MSDENQGVLSRAIEAIAFRFMYGDVIFRNLINTTKKNFKSSFETNLEDAKYMTQTSFLILSKWENLVNVVGLLFDMDLKNISVESLKKNAVEYASLYNIKKTLNRFTKYGQLFLTYLATSLAMVGDQGWIFLKVATLYWSWFFLRSLTWNRVILSLLCILGKRALKERQFKSITEFLTSYVNFFC